MNWTQLWLQAQQLVVLHPLAAYLAIFFVALSESLALIGLLVPGTVIMFAIGALAGSGALSVKITLLSAMAGAVVGDGLSYWLGHHYHQGLKGLWPFRKYPKMLIRGEEFFQRHGGKSILFGRFVGPVRPVIPLIAGMLDMPARRFVLVNVFSAIGWAFAYLIPGVVLGSSLTLVSAVSTRLSLLLLLLGLLVWLTFWLCRRIYGWLGLLGPRGERLLPLLGLSLVGASWLFLGVLEDLLNLDPLVRADQAIYQFLQTLRTPWGDQLLVAVTELGGSLTTLPVIMTVLLVLLLHRKLRAAAYWLVAVGGGAGLVQLFKWTLQRPRPIAIYQGISTWSFPSGHTTMSVVLYGFLAILLVRSFSARWRWLPFGCALGISFLIAFSRLYLGAHWFSDVLGGLALGWIWVAALGIFYLRHATAETPRRLLLVSVFLMLMLAGAGHIQFRHAQDLQRYQVQKPLQNLHLERWWKQDWQQLPGWRIDLAGEPEQPLTIQWAGNPDQLALQLVAQGWTQETGSSLKKMLNLFVPHVRIQQLPLLPRLENGQRERLLLSLLQGERRLVLRLWPTKYRLAESGRALWVGTVESEHAAPTVGLLTLARGSGDYNKSLALVAQALKPGSTRRVNRAPQRQPVPGRWDGQVLLSGESEIIKAAL